MANVCLVVEDVMYEGQTNVAAFTLIDAAKAYADKRQQRLRVETPHIKDVNFIVEQIELDKEIA